jgi:hypothetical protein
MGVLQVRRRLVGSGNPQRNLRILEQRLLDLRSVRLLSRTRKSGKLDWNRRTASMST